MRNNELERRLRRIEYLLLLILKLEDESMKEMDDLAAEVKNQSTVADSVKVLITNLNAHSADPAKLAALVAQMKQNDQVIADAVASGTEADPAIVGDPTDKGPTGATGGTGASGSTGPTGPDLTVTDPAVTGDVGTEASAGTSAPSVA